jgi:hypothetical protein
VEAAEGNINPNPPTSPVLNPFGATYVQPSATNLAMGLPKITAGHPATTGTGQTPVQPEIPRAGQADSDIGTTGINAGNNAEKAGSTVKPAGNIRPVGEGKDSTSNIPVQDDLGGENKPNLTAPATDETAAKDTAKDNGVLPPARPEENTESASEASAPAANTAGHRGVGQTVRKHNRR